MSRLKHIEIGENLLTSCYISYGARNYVVMCYTCNKLPCKFSTSYNFAGKPLSETITLKELDVQPNGTIRLEVTSSNPEQVPLKSSPTREQPGTSDVITVRLIKGSQAFA